MNAGDLAAYAGRDWNQMAELKTRHWREMRAREGAIGMLRASEAASRTIRLLRPDWPSEQDRAADYEEHLRLCRILEEADRGRRR